ncbi:glycosyltransferase [bacterium]|nr:glycosyltransferase [bacterium]
MSYSLIIPLYNEEKTLNTLLGLLKLYFDDGNEIVIIDDGSSDNSVKILKDCNFINLIQFKENKGKGFAIREGLKHSKHNKTIIYDSDLELDIKDLSKLMNLDKKNKIVSIMGVRSKSFNPFRSGLDWGNFIFTTFFNFLYRSCHKDILCCAKAFYKSNIPIHKLKSKGFDIDIELSSIITKNSIGKSIPQVVINYTRRSISEGKKLKISDGWSILFRVINDFI